MQIDAQLKALLPHYDDWQFLGAGGFGQTWRARDTLQEEHVVVKTRPLTEAAERAVIREAELMSRLHHEGLQRFYSVMKTAETLVLIYAYVDGCSLARHLQEQGALPQDKALAIIEQLLAAVEVIHAADFIHRDVTPHNVILRSDGTPVLIDFNALGHLTESSSIGVSTVVGEFAGKPLYMSPEQIAAAPQTAAVDVWAIGALLFEMVAGRSLRQGLTLAEVVQSSVSVDCPDVFDAPRVLHPFLTSCLQADAALRPSASEARTMIEALRASALVTDASPAAKKSHRALSWLWLGIAVFAAMSGAAAVFLVGMFGRQSQIPDPPPPPSPLPLSPPPLASPTLWDWFLLADQLSIAIIFFGVTLIAFGFLAARFLRHRASELRVALPYEAMQLISGPDAQKRLSETICVQIDAYRDLAGNAADKMLTLTMVALAKEYKDAETHDQRIATLKMLHELHGKIATRLQPWWLSYETVMARGISLASLAGGVLVVLEGLQRLL